MGSRKACMSEGTEEHHILTHRIALPFTHDTRVSAELSVCALPLSLSLSLASTSLPACSPYPSFLLVDVLHLLLPPTGRCSPELEHSCIRVIARGPD